METDIDLRRIGPDDIAWMADADPRLASDAVHRAHIVDLLAAGLSWAAFADDAGVGFAVVTRHFFGFPFVDLVVVAETRRRCGVGEALMARCATAHDADRIFTSTNESNTPMRRLLVKADWLTAGVIEYLDPGDPELVFVKLRA
jgi:GNAT superfamily N-acetyltransferase